MHKKIGIFIPCYNVEKSIQSVLQSFSQEVLGQVDRILVIDNHSADSTLQALAKLQREETPVSKKLTIIKNLENYGLGGSQKIAYQYFLDNGFSHFMIIHGDNQGAADEIARSFLAQLKTGPDLDLVFASRFDARASLQNYSWLRTIGNRFFNKLTWLFTGLHMSDAGTGIILYRAEILRRVPFMALSNFFHFNPQLNILLYEDKSLKIAHVPLSWRDSKDASNVSPIPYCIELSKILFLYGISKFIMRRGGIKGLRQEKQSFEPKFETMQPSYFGPK